MGIYVINCSSFRGLSLNQIIAILEEDKVTENTNEANITLLPPENANGNITDEDSGEEDEVNLSNLPASQLRTQAEIVYVNPRGT